MILTSNKIPALSGYSNTAYFSENVSMDKSANSNLAEVLSQTWLVIPLYNEGEVISEVISEAIKTFPNIICVDDGSKDKSGLKALEAGAWVATHSINLGQGAALQTGIDFVLKKTNGKYLITFDSDGQHRIEDALSMIAVAEAEDLGFVLGSRFLSGTAETGALKRFVLKTVAFITRMRTGQTLTDAHNGLRLLRRDTAEMIYINQNRMAHASELVDQLLKSGQKWKEIPVHIIYTDYSRSKGQSLLNGINILTELILK